MVLQTRTDNKASTEWASRDNKSALSAYEKNEGNLRLAERTVSVVKNSAGLFPQRNESFFGKHRLDNLIKSRDSHLSFGC